MHDDEPLHGYERGYVTDPFGYRIELMQQNAWPAFPDSNSVSRAMGSCS
jgi:hypothetical protein